MRETFITEDLLNILINLEMLGNKNYAKLAENVEDKKSREFFNILAMQELKHKEIYEGFKNNLPDSEHIDPDYQEYARIMIEKQIPILKGMAMPESFEDGLKMAIELEKETIFFLHEVRGLLPGKQAHQVDPMISEERKHLQYVLAYQG